MNSALQSGWGGVIDVLIATIDNGFFPCSPPPYRGLRGGMVSGGSGDFLRVAKVIFEVKIPPKFVDSLVVRMFHQ